eukprot:1138687-Pelagomonas_calceolata.AAC.2
MFRPFLHELLLSYEQASGLYSTHSFTHPLTQNSSRDCSPPSTVEHSLQAPTWAVYCAHCGCLAFCSPSTVVSTRQASRASGVLGFSVKPCV